MQSLVKFVLHAGNQVTWMHVENAVLRQLGRDLESDLKAHLKSDLLHD